MRRKGVVKDGVLYFELSFDPDSDSDMEELEGVMRDEYSRPRIRHMDEEEIIVLIRPNFRPDEDERYL